MKDRIKQYLANGLKPSQIVTLVGCSPSYISNLLKDEEFKKEVEALAIANPASVDDKLSDKYDSLEHELVKRIHDESATADLPQLSRALEVVSKARANRKGIISPSDNGGNNYTYISLTVPAHIVQAPPTVELNSQGEVIAIDAKPMAPMSADGVRGMFEKMAATKAIPRLEEI